MRKDCRLTIPNRSQRFIRKTMKCLVETDKCITLLSEVKGLRVGSGLPSWVPDWRIDPKVKTLASTNKDGTKIYRASATSYPKLAIEPSVKLMSVYGVSFDKASSHLGRVLDISEGRNYVPWIGLTTYSDGLWAKMVRSVYPNGIYTPTGEPLTQAYDRVLTDDQLLTSERMDKDAKAASYPETLAFINAMQSDSNHPLFPQAIKQMKGHNIDLDAVLKSYIKGPELYASEDIMSYLYKSPLLDDVPDDILGHVHSEREALQRAVTGGRKLFVSASGHMGLCPEATEAGDVICILFGADVPSVLRPLRSGGYSLVGECYLDGFMDGQALVKANKDAGVDEAVQGLGAPTREFILE